MASSATDICNLALAHLGEARITSLDEDSVASRACSLHYAMALDAALRAHRWNFAQARQTLSRLTDAPGFGWSYQYQLPADCLRVVEFNRSETGDVVSEEFIVEGRVILTDAEEVQIVYIRRITDAGTFDALFVETFALALAVKLSETIRGTTGKTAELETRYRNFVAPLARRTDANEGKRRKGLLPLNSHFVRARYTGS